MSQTSGTVALSYSKFEPEKFRELLGAAIVLHDLPFSFVEYSGIRAVFSFLNPSVTLISRNTAKADIQKLHKREKERIVYMLNASPGRINFTSDLWTSVATDGYMSLTAHFIDKDWVLQKRVLNFSLMPPPHSGIALSEKIYNLLSEWGIEKKVFAFTLDNASSNDVAVDMLRMQLNMKNVLMSKGEFLHLRCCTHVLNLIVQEGLKEIDESVNKIRETVKYIRGSQVRKQKFLESVKQMSLDNTRGLRQDVPTRWNSTFLMLESAIFYRCAFCHLQLTDSNYKHCPNADEWNKVEKLCAFLAVFYDCTRIFSGTKYPTANLFFPAIWMVYLHLVKQMENEDAYIKDMARRMFTKFDKYWSEFVPILAIAVVLDPRYKLQFVDFSYRQIYNNPNSIEFLKVKEKLYSLFSEYESKSKSSSSSFSSIQTGTKLCGGISLSHSREASNMLKEFDQFDSEEMLASSKKSQLDLYLDEQRMSRDVELDVLNFWKGNEIRYPEVASMARDILSIPVSTVASESAFSIGGLVLDQYRSSLNPKTVTRHEYDTTQTRPATRIASPTVDALS